MKEFTADRVTISLRLRFEKEMYNWKNNQQHLDIFLSLDGLEHLMSDLIIIKGLIDSE